ncbi:uncharacterized protein LOC112049100 [Bicyclus anynana]|uniref:Uncharacterized protein LOC112049100 n=1 Tax=Bicyclus anynana TaxID=110368 RepID=A0ABM3LX37_BICAN|nr:uncharacterized protein LOC112049100 [Bicyclus anynana]
MSSNKLNSDEVPQKFIEWVLALGCPGEKIPSIEKMTGMCRGQYYMTWRSMMEHVQPKDEIGHKRLSVFLDDVKMCQEKKLLNERGSSSLLPEQLSLWKEQTEIKEKVKEAETRVNNARVTLNELMDKVSGKVIQRNSSRQRIEDLQRRHWLLTQVSSELQTKIANIEETRTIANSLCSVEKEAHDVKSQLEDCLARLRKSQPSTLPLATPVACSSINSNHANETTSNDKDQRVLSLVNCRGDALWPHLYDKMSSLYSQLSDAYTNHADVGNNRSQTGSMLAHTAALHATLALEAVKNRVHIRRTQQQLVASIEETNSHISEDAFELLVVRAQRAFCEARVKSLKASLEELTARTGVFHSADDRSDCGVDAQATLGKIASINKCIVKSREEIKRLTLLFAHTERKIYNIRECLLSVFSALHNNTDVGNNALATGVQLDFPTDSILLLRQFYKKRCERDANNANLSFNLEMSDISSDDVSVNPTFVDELNVYLKKFNLEKNRKLVLDSGEKIWIFETIQALSRRLSAQWASADVTLLCPSVRPSRALRRLRDTTQRHALVACAQRNAQRTTDIQTSIDADITTMTDQEAETMDKMKKSITENRVLLQKVHRNLELCEENLHFWSDHQLKKYISTDRTVGGMTYAQYEASYMEKLNY